MTNINSLFTFIFIFSLLTIIRLVIRFTGALLQTPPEKLVLSSRELFINGLLLSYLITYIISKF